MKAAPDPGYFAPADWVDPADWDRPRPPVSRAAPARTRADIEAANELLGLVRDREAHGQHAILPTGRVSCGSRSYKNGYAPCQLEAWAFQS